MKRALIVFLLALSSSVTPFAQIKTDRERDGLKGPVQTVRVRKTTLLVENGRKTSSPILMSHAVTYDQSGNRREMVIYDDTGTFRRRIVYAYDPHTKNRSSLTTYDSQNVVLRKVIDTYGSTGLKTNSNIHDYNDDGTLFRRTELKFDSFGLMVEVATYDKDGSPIKTEHAPFVEPEREYLTPAREPSTTSADRLVSYGRGANELGEPDSHGNWIEGSMPSTFREYSSGKKTRITEVLYREFTYYNE